MRIKNYRKKTHLVKAIQVTEETAEEAARWCGGVLVREIDPLDENNIRPGINVPTLEGVMRASMGDYILQHQDGRREIMHEVLFEDQYEVPRRG